MRSRGSVEAQRDQYKRMFGTDPDTIPEPYLESRAAGVSIPATQDTWAVLLRRVAGLRGIKPGMYLGEELANVAAPTLVLWGEHDMAPLEEGRRESARIAEAQFVAMTGLGPPPVPPGSRGDGAADQRLREVQPRLLRGGLRRP